MKYTKIIKSDFLNDKTNIYQNSKTVNPKKHKNEVSTVNIIDKRNAMADLVAYVQKHIRYISNYFLKSEYSSQQICLEIDKILDKTEEDIINFLEHHFQELIKYKEQQEGKGLFKDL